MPVILDPSGKGKISKRRKQIGDQVFYVLVREFREAGYLPETMFNFLARIGWGMDAETEVFDREEATARFELSAVNPAPASPPYSKLDWLNGLYIRRLPVEDLARRLSPVLQSAGLEVEPVTVQHYAARQERIKTLNDAIAMRISFFRKRSTTSPGCCSTAKLTPRPVWLHCNVPTHCSRVCSLLSPRPWRLRYARSPMSSA
jgi:glutamyl-tRNA synthetase